MPRKIFLVVGLGVLGKSVAENLAREGAEVIAVDSDPDLVDGIKDSVEVAVELDATDPKALAQLDLRNLDAAVVCIGERFEAAVLATANLLDLGVKHVKSRANNPLSESILQRLGAHDVFFVESAMGRIIAHRMVQPAVTTEMELGDGYRIIQCNAPSLWFEKSLQDLALPQKYRVQVIAIRAGSNHQMHTATAATVVGEGDQFFLSGHGKDLSRLLEQWKPNSENESSKNS